MSFVIKDELIKGAYFREINSTSGYPVYTYHKNNAMKYETRIEAEMVANQIKFCKVIEEGES